MVLNKMLFEYQDILQLHAELRNVIHKDEVLEWIKSDKIQSHLFLSMCETIHNDIHRDALFGLCKKFQFVRPVARRALKNFMAQYTQVKAGRPVEGYQISEKRQWNHDTTETILALREEQYEPTDAILRCVKDMIQHDLHMKAMFEVCERYGYSARTLVTYVLKCYKDACKNGKADFSGVANAANDLITSNPE